MCMPLSCDNRSPVSGSREVTHWGGQTTQSSVGYSQLHGQTTRRSSAMEPNSDDADEWEVSRGK